PEYNTVPFGSRCMRGYSGGVQPAANSWLHPDPTVYSSTAVFVPPISFNPEKVITRPSPSTVVVGYQRPCAMFCRSVNRPVAGSNAALRGSPWKGSYCRLPPLMSGRPSGRTTIPLQNMSQPSDCVTSVSVCGSQTAA